MGAAYTAFPADTSFHAPALKLPLILSAPYLLMSTSAFWISKFVRWSASSMTTSGAPLPAETAVWNLLYSSPPCPTLVQQTCTSLWPLLKLSTTLAMFGYQAHTVTTGADFTTILFVQFFATDE